MLATMALAAFLTSPIALAPDASSAEARATRTATARGNAGKRGKDEIGSKDERAEPPPPAAVQAEAVAELDTLAEKYDEFLASKIFERASRSFHVAVLAAASMVDRDGTVDEKQRDRFHDYTDEFLRALRQLDYPGNHHSDSASRDEKRAARKLEKALIDLAERVDEEPALRRVSTERLTDRSAEELAVHVPRIVARVRVILDHRGMGPVFKDAHEATKPLHAELTEVTDLAARLPRTEGEERAAVQDELDERLEACIDLTHKLAKAFKALKEPSMGNRERLVVNELAALRMAIGADSRQARKDR